jgi:hypothetical protein
MGVTHETGCLDGATGRRSIRTARRWSDWATATRIAVYVLMPAGVFLGRDDLCDFNRRRWSDRNGDNEGQRKHESAEHPQ